jgi:hypothetical protein
MCWSERSMRRDRVGERRRAGGHALNCYRPVARRKW